MTEKTAKDSHYARLRRLHRSQKAGSGPQHIHSTKSQFRGESPAEGRLWIYGLHSVQAALANPRRILHRLFVTKNAYNRLYQSQISEKKADLALSDSSIPTATEEPHLTTKAGISVPLTLTEPKALDKLLGSQAVHQGVALETEPLKPQKQEDFSDSRLILLLDQVTDPHNVGAIMRSAVAFNVDLFITTAWHSPQETGVLAKSASGALEKIDHLTVRNLANTLENLKQAGFQTIGLDSEGEQILEASFKGEKIALILGAEGRGLRQKTRQTVDSLARLCIPGAIQSLNVSNAAAIALYAAHSYQQKSR